ncbi:mitochondrial 2-oxodicarboxylate carrier-like [Saccoglossus kowalevskii]|uniref:Mitochondrial 2-oxodicarboxylate carrier n=1 Tax=Saccoglossus kowalevskii TaxID=10224 RepID=A0ABM0GNT1_SACKO|nr:PREDICTED: mitochondrial 2-oxodicarboxylate carrier-like [Saccoglossus kowalevskii]
MTANKAREAAQQMTAGALTGIVEVSLMQPLDLIKTRFQIQGSTNDPTAYKSLADCFRTIYRLEGITSFYKGILPAILAETSKRAVRFFTFEQYKNIFLFGAAEPNVLTFITAGLGSGLTEAFIINPLEVVKVKLQAERATILAEQQSAFTVARIIAREHSLGLKGLNKGLTATLGRHGAFNCVYFSFYHSVKGWIPAAENSKLEFCRRFAIGLVSGTLATMINIPFDVAKSRIQGPQPVPGEVKYRACFKTMATIYREEGFFALYKGFIPKVMRLGPGGAIAMLVFEYSYEWLKKNT